MVWAKETFYNNLRLTFFEFYVSFDGPSLKAEWEKEEDTRIPCNAITLYLSATFDLAAGEGKVSCLCQHLVKSLCLFVSACLKFKISWNSSWNVLIDWVFNVYSLGTQCAWKTHKIWSVEIPRFSKLSPSAKNKKLSSEENYEILRSLFNTRWERLKKLKYTTIS